MVIRAGRKVKMSTEGLAMFPDYEGLAGELQGYDSPKLARVLFDGRAHAISLDASFVEETDMPMTPVTARESATARRNRGIVENRKILHRAYMTTRKTDKVLSTDFAKALGGGAEITSRLLEMAKAVNG